MLNRVTPALQVDDRTAKNEGSILSPSVEYYDRIRISAFVGLGFRYAPISSQVPGFLHSYVRKLMEGKQFGFNGEYYLSRKVGIGFRYNRFNSHNQLDNVAIMDTAGRVQTGLLSDKITISYTGVGVTFRIPRKRTSAVWYLHYIIGKTSFIDRAVQINPFTISGSSIASNFGLGLDFDIAPQVAISMGVSLQGGVLTSYERDDGVRKTTVQLDKPNYEGLGRFDVGVGLSWRLARKNLKSPK